MVTVSVGADAYQTLDQLRQRIDYDGGEFFDDNEQLRFDELLVQARGELDEAKRRQMYYEMQKIVRNQGGTVVPMFANYVFAVSDKVQHDGTLAGNWNLDGWKFAERWWFES